MASLTATAGVSTGGAGYHTFGLRFSSLQVFGAVIFLIGLTTPWVEMPLSDSYRLLDIGIWNWSAGVFAVLYVLSLAAYFLLELFGFRRLTLLPLFFIGLLLFGFLLELGFSGHDWWISYLSESYSKQNIVTLYSSDHYWPNINREPTSVSIPDFQYLWDRAVICWYMMSFGCTASIAAYGFLLVNRLQQVRSAAVITILGLLVVAISLFAFSAQLNAEVEQRYGDRVLAGGRYVAALEAYQKSIALDPTLKYSREFAVKASYAYLKQEGKDSLFARLARSVTKPTAATSSPSDVYYTFYRLSEADQLVDGSLLQRAIVYHTGREATRTLVKGGLNSGIRADYSNSIALLRPALQRSYDIDALVLVAHSEIALRLDEEAIADLVDALTMVKDEGVRANILCSIGDAYEQRGDPLEARVAYEACLNTDDYYNYRATRNLSGT